jgi:glycine/D-amino acid oxidase-like deaminating enzyme/Rieske Fe-S protein
MSRRWRGFYAGSGRDTNGWDGGIFAEPPPSQGLAFQVEAAFQPLQTFASSAPPARLAGKEIPMPSLWKAETRLQPFPTLEEDLACDLLVVGSGIAGLSSAYEAARCGAKCIVIDRGEIAGGMTARTTAHLASEIDDFYSELIRAVGEEQARLYHESQVAAVNRIEAICAKEGIGADFSRVPGYLVAASSDDQADLEDEYRACLALGIEVEWAERAPISLPEGTKALKFAEQARFHPLKYCSGLALGIENREGRLFSNTAYASHHEQDDHVVVRTDTGRTIRAGAVLFATNSPVNDTVKVHTKQVPMRTYAMAGRVPAGSIEDALTWDTLEAYHYVRLQPAREGQDWLIVGGEDHRSGTANDMEERFARLEAWTRARFPAATTFDYRWSGQVMEPVDFLPYSGRDGSDRIYLHSGDSGQGMTNGVAGALNFIALYRNDKARFAELFNPSRKPKSGLSLGEYVKGQGPVVANLGEYLSRGEVDSIDQIKPGEGAIVRRGAAKHAVYRAEDGAVTERSAICTHVGCIVHWNGFEKCWDCPCHGSQFLPDGTVLNGPATRPLAKIDATARGTEKIVADGVV